MIAPGIEVAIDANQLITGGAAGNDDGNGGNDSRKDVSKISPISP